MTGKEFKQLRLDAGLTQAQLAERVGANIRMIQKYEGEEIPLAAISVTTAWRLATQLGIDTAEFADRR